MKKVLSIIMTVSMILSCAMLYACGATDKASDIQLDAYKVYGMIEEETEDGASVRMMSAALPEEWFVSRKHYQSDKAAPTFTANIFGQEYVFDYWRSNDPQAYKNISDGRQDVYGNSGVGCTVDAQTGKVLVFRGYDLKKWVDPTFDENGNATYQMSDAEIVEMANTYVKQLVGEEQFAKYQLYREHRAYFDYYRVVNGHKTSERVSLRLSAYGEVIYYGMWNIGMYDDVTDYKFNENKAISAVKKQITEYYKDTQYKVESITPMPIVLPNGQNAYEYTVKTSFCVEQYEDGSADWGGETFSFVIPAE